jgi:hypothetical protein
LQYHERHITGLPLAHHDLPRFKLLQLGGEGQQLQPCAIHSGEERDAPQSLNLASQPAAATHILGRDVALTCCAAAFIKGHHSATLNAKTGIKMIAERLTGAHPDQPTVREFGLDAGEQSLAYFGLEQRQRFVED